MTPGPLADFHRSVATAKGELLPASRALTDFARRFDSVLNELGDAWSRSNIGPQALIYRHDLKPPPPGVTYNREWGLHREQSGWKSFDAGQINAHIEKRSRATISELTRRTSELADAIERHQHELVLRCSYFPDQPTLAARCKALEDLPGAKTVPEIATGFLSGAVMTRDTESLTQGRWLAPHLRVHAETVAAVSVADRASELCRLAERAHAVASATHRIAPADTTASVPAAPAPVRVAEMPPAVTVRVPALAVTIVALAVAGLLWITVMSTAPASATWGARRIVAAAAGGAGATITVLAVSVFWHGVVRHDVNYLVLAGAQVQRAAALGFAAALLTLFGIG